jgi:phosphodiesterase/alkaline phosphatase D-like protein
VLRRLVLVVVVLAGLISIPATASGANFNFGVAAGDVSSSSALLWTRANAPGSYAVQVALDPGFRQVVAGRRLTISRSTDGGQTFRVVGLRAGRRHYYRFTQCETGTAGSSLTCKRAGRASPIGTFLTAPATGANATVRFAYSGDADAQPKPPSRTPFWNRFQVYRRMQLERNAFNVNLGDTIYSDSEVQGAQGLDATTVAQKWGKYRMNLAQLNLQALRGSSATYSQWDDHEFINDFSRFQNTFSTGSRSNNTQRTFNINGQVLYGRGAKAFRDYTPISYSSRYGTYSTFRWGRNVQVFRLDERSFRSTEADYNGTCNDSSGNPDLGPTAPQSTRNTFAAIYPPLAQPPSQQCINTINDPRRTMLGSAQLARFMSDLRRSTATWKVVLNEDPIQQFYVFPYDRWEGYEAERKTLMNFISANVKNVVFLTTDQHANMVNTVKFSTLGENGPPVDTGVFDFVTGPVATKNFNQEVNDALNNPSGGNLVTSVVLKGPPPNGVAMKCAATAVFSYSEVVASQRTLTVTPKDINGRLVHEAPQDGGGPCGPFSLTAR